MTDIRKLLDIIEDVQIEPTEGDVIELELGDTLIETTITEVLEDGIVIHVDETALKLMIDAKKQLNEGLRNPKDNPCWKGYHPVGTKKKNGKTVPNCVPKEGLEEGRMKDLMWDDAESMDLKDFLERWAHRPEDEEWVTDFWKGVNGEEEMDEAKYHGREVPLGKPMKGDVKKKKVYVRKPNGNIVKVEFGDPNMRIKKSNPARRKSFRARHHCENPGPRWKARYWSCRAW